VRDGRGRRGDSAVRASACRNAELRTDRRRVWPSNLQWLALNALPACHPHPDPRRLMNDTTGRWGDWTVFWCRCSNLGVAGGRCSKSPREKKATEGGARSNTAVGCWVLGPCVAHGSRLRQQLCPGRQQSLLSALRPARAQPGTHSLAHSMHACHPISPMHQNRLHGRTHALRTSRRTQASSSRYSVAAHSLNSHIMRCSLNMAKRDQFCILGNLVTNIVKECVWLLFPTQLDLCPKTFL